MAESLSDEEIDSWTDDIQSSDENITAKAGRRLLTTIAARDERIVQLEDALRGLVDLHERGSQVVFEDVGEDYRERSVYPWDHYIDWQAIRALLLSGSPNPPEDNYELNQGDHDE